MQSKRDRVLIFLLCTQAGASAASGSALLANVASPLAVASIGLFSAVLSSVTATYVAATRDYGPSADRRTPDDVQVG